MTTENNKVKLFQKLLEIQKIVKGVGKDSKSFGYSYTSGSKIIAEIKPLMNQFGLLLKQEVISIVNERQDYATKQGNKSEILTTTVQKFTWVDTETGETDENLFAANGQNDWEKGLGSALTYAERYFLLKYFHISTDEDDIDNPDRKGSSTTKQPNIPKTPAPRPPAPIDKVRDKALATPSTSAGNPPSKVAEAPKAESGKPISPNKAMDVTDEESRKAKAKKAFEGLDKATVLGYIIKDLKLKYVSINDFIEKEPIDLVLSTYAAVQALPPVKKEKEDK